MFLNDVRMTYCKELSLNVIEFTVTRFDQQLHTRKPLSELRHGEDLSKTLLPGGYTFHSCLGNDRVEGATGIREDAIYRLPWPLLAKLFEKCH